MQSRFIKLTDYCLLEYQYESLSPSSPILIDSPFYALTLGEGEIYLYNPDSALYETGNTKDLTAVPLASNSGRFVYLDAEDSPNYTEYVTGKVDGASETLIPAGSIIADRVRFHFASGFQFDDFSSLVLSIRQDMNNGNALILASILLNSTTLGDVLLFATRPMIIGNSMYDRYVDIIVPSIKNMDEQFYTSPNPSTTFEYKATTVTVGGSQIGVGLVKNNPITVNLFECKDGPAFNTEDEVYSTYDINQAYTAQVTQSNDFDLVGAKIREAADGDYIEFFATWNGGFPEEFIGILEKRSGHSWIIFHQLTVFEQLGSTFVKSGDATFFQETNFDEPLIYRPILKNANEAVSMAIDYSVRLVNRTTNEQIIRTGSMVVVNPNKYGKQLSKLELLDKPNSNRINNLIIRKVTDSIRSFDEAAANKPATSTNQAALATQSTEVVPQIEIRTVKEYVPVLFSNNSILLAESSKMTGNGANSEVAYGQGLLSIVVSPFDNVFKFKVKQQKLNTSGNPTVKTIDLTQFTSFELVFGTDNSRVTIKNSTNQAETNADLGEILFKFDSAITSKILMLEDPKFYIVSVGSDGTRTALYTGKWYKPDGAADADMQNAAEESRIKSEENLKKRLDELSALVDQLRDENASLRKSTIKHEVAVASNSLSATASETNPVIQVKPVSQITTGYGSSGSNYGSGGVYYGGGCPTPSMLILTGEDSWIKAGELIKGTRIYTIHEHTGKWGYYEIESAEPTIQPAVRVKFGEHSVEVSESHRFLTEDSEYVRISDLSVGSVIETLDGPEEILSIESIGEAEVIKIEVDDAHTYVVEGAISHNKMTRTLE